MNEFTSFCCCASEIASNAVAYAAAAEEAAIARGEAMTVQAETVARGADCVTTEVNTNSCIRYGPVPEAAGRCLFAEEMEQCHARAKCTEVMDVTTQHRKSDYNNATAFSQHSIATGHFESYKTKYSHHGSHSQTTSLPEDWNNQHALFVSTYRPLNCVIFSSKGRAITSAVHSRTLTFDWIDCPLIFQFISRDNVSSMNGFNNVSILGFDFPDHRPINSTFSLCKLYVSLLSINFFLPTLVLNKQGLSSA